MARRLGATEEWLAALARGELDPFPEAWRAALVYADAVTVPGSEVPESVWAELARLWSPAQIVEITSVIALFNYFNRFAEALHIPVTR